MKNNWRLFIFFGMIIFALILITVQAIIFKEKLRDECLAKGYEQVESKQVDDKFGYYCAEEDGNLSEIDE